MSTKHTPILNRGAARLLATMLAQPQWYTEAITAARACAILEMPELDQDAGKLEGPALKAWEREEVTLPITEKQRETIKACIEAHAKRGSMMPGRSVGTLLGAFGFAPTDE